MAKKLGKLVLFGVFTLGAGLAVALESYILGLPVGAFGVALALEFFGDLGGTA